MRNNYVPLRAWKGRAPPSMEMQFIVVILYTERAFFI